MRVADLTMDMPVILLGLALVAAFGSSVPSLVLILGILFMPATARLARSAPLGELRADYHLAAISRRGVGPVGSIMGEGAAAEHDAGPARVCAPRWSRPPRRSSSRRASASSGSASSRRRASWGTLLQAATRPLPLLLVSDLPGRRHPRRRPGAEHARRRPPADPRPLPPVSTPVLDERRTILDLRDLTVEFAVIIATSTSPRRVVLPRRRRAPGPRRRVRLRKVPHRALPDAPAAPTATPAVRCCSSAANSRSSPSARWPRPWWPHRDRLSGSDVVAEPDADDRGPGRRGDPDHERAGGTANSARSTCSARSAATSTRRVGSYPHQFSGGMRQRAMIAMAIAAGPQVLLADEPISALDVTTEARIIDPLDRLGAQRELAVLLSPRPRPRGQLLRHGPGDVRRPHRRASPSGAVFEHPVHPYTEALVRSICRIDADVNLRLRRSRASRRCHTGCRRGAPSTCAARTRQRAPSASRGRTTSTGGPRRATSPRARRGGRVSASPWRRGAVHRGRAGSPRVAAQA